MTFHDKFRISKAGKELVSQKNRSGLRQNRLNSSIVHGNKVCCLLDNTYKRKVNKELEILMDKLKQLEFEFPKGFASQWLCEAVQETNRYRLREIGQLPYVFRRNLVV